jgi:hypothetical protein
MAQELGIGNFKPDGGGLQPAADGTVGMLAALLRSDRELLIGLENVDPQWLCDEAEAHGVLPLLAEQLRGVPLPTALSERLERQLRVGSRNRAAGRDIGSRRCGGPTFDH